MVKIEPLKDIEGVYRVLGLKPARIATRNLTPGRQVYGEKLIVYEGVEYRVWDPYRSKFSAAILKGLNRLPIGRGSRILYLGAATGTTSSHVSDIVGDEGVVYCVEFSARALRELVMNVARYRENMVPILSDARLPEAYRFIVDEVDGIYCDIAQPEQARVLADNADLYLKPGGFILLAVKARSIDVKKSPKEIYEREVNILKERGFKIRSVINIESYHKDHVMVYATYKP
ncbi:MAG: fibrillarin-like rRNA/tRNA 2'-O-methyltransferase [Candidatus Bathyarchaeia archaeon]|nr:fibrillarin-like rRNA/tRNA 2'-O-methyltransferase [Candidatus Bathyarchaeota archaeon]